MKDGYGFEVKHVRLFGESHVSIEDDTDLMMLVPIAAKEGWHERVREDHLQLIEELFRTVP